MNGGLSVTVVPHEVSLMCRHGLAQVAMFLDQSVGCRLSGFAKISLQTLRLLSRLDLQSLEIVG